MDAIKFLIKEHNRFKKIFLQITHKKRFSTKLALFEKLCQELIRHEKMEHTLWYPHFKKNKNMKSEIRHLISEEKKSTKGIKIFKKIKTEAEWEEKFYQFKDQIEHHASEEENNLFPHVQKIIDKTTLEKIGKKMKIFRDKYRDKYH